eukprot:gene5464-7566_t
MSNHYLLSSFKLGNLTLKNRVVMAPLTRGRCNPQTRLPNDFVKEYYQQRASAGLIISEAIAISEQGYGWYGAGGIYSSEQAQAWKRIVDGVHEKDGKIFLQLWHMGRQSHSSFHKTNEIVAASAIPVPPSGSSGVRDANNEKAPYEIPREIRTDEVSTIVSEYQKAAYYAKEAGFDGVEIHAANGYLIDTFLQSITNLRTDEYGGSLENRYRFLKEIVEAISQIYPLDRIGVRLSPNGAFGGMGSSDNDVMFPFVASKLKEFGGLAYIHLMDGLGFGYHNKCPPVNLYTIKQAFGGVVMGNVGYTHETAEGAIRTGAVDLIAFGRPYITNPDLVERFANNWPLAPPAPTEAWYGVTEIGPAGYTEYPPYSESK